MRTCRSEARYTVTIDGDAISVIERSPSALAPTGLSAGSAAPVAQRRSQHRVVRRELGVAVAVGGAVAALGVARVAAAPQNATRIARTTVGISPTLHAIPPAAC